MNINIYENYKIKEILEEIDNKIIPNEHWNKIKDYITNLQEENEDYKTRCEKATEFIEKSRVKATPFFKQFDGDLLMPKREVDKLLNILNGGDE